MDNCPVCCYNSTQEFTCVLKNEGASSPENARGQTHYFIMEGTNMKKILAFLMALCMVFALCAVSFAADEPVTLVYAEVNPLEGTIVGEMAKAFKAKVEELSGGSVMIDIQASGVLGSEDQILDNLLG